MRDIKTDPKKMVESLSRTGLGSLRAQSRRPKTSPLSKVGSHEESLILQMRQERNLGARRIQSELKRLHDVGLAMATIHKVLVRHNVKPLLRVRKKKDYKRYSRPIPGDRVQLDTCKIANGLYQYTAIDDCTRYRVLRLYKRRTASNTLDFIDCVIEEMPFPIQRIQTDRGLEFFAEDVQKRLKEYSIKFRPNKPGSPHLNGKVERSQKTDKTEFYATIDLKSDQLDEMLAERQHYYNWERPHSALNGKSPIDVHFDLIHETPFSDEVCDLYSPDDERLQHHNYWLNLELQRLKLCL